MRFSLLARRAAGIAPPYQPAVEKRNERAASRPVRISKWKLDASPLFGFATTHKTTHLSTPTLSRARMRSTTTSTTRHEPGCLHPQPHQAASSHPGVLRAHVRARRYETQANLRDHQLGFSLAWKTTAGHASACCSIVRWSAATVFDNKGGDGRSSSKWTIVGAASGFSFDMKGDGHHQVCASTLGRYYRRVANVININSGQPRTARSAALLRCSGAVQSPQSARFAYAMPILGQHWAAWTCRKSTEPSATCALKGRNMDPSYQDERRILVASTRARRQWSMGASVATYLAVVP